MMSASSRKIAVVTGSTGIGAATAARLVSRGWGVFVVSRTAAHVESAVAQLNVDADRAEPAAAGQSFDLADSSAADEVLAACLAAHGRVDAIFNVAGSSGRSFGDGPPHLCTDEGWRRTLDVNLTSQFAMCRAHIRHWLDEPAPERGLRGVVLNMSSVLGLDPAPVSFDTLAYGVSKSAIIGMSRIMAAHYAGYGISVNVIAPGLVETPMSARASGDADVQEFISRKQPLTGGMVPLDDTAELAAFMIDQGAKSMTGQVVHPEGGWQLS